MRLAVDILVPLATLCLGFYVGLNIQWQPFDRRTWGEHMRVRKVEPEKVALWVAVVALLVTSVALTMSLRQVAAFGDYVECRASLDEAVAQDNRRRRADLRVFVGAARRVALVALSGDDPEKARATLDALRDAGDAYLDSDSQETPLEACGEPSR